MPRSSETQIASGGTPRSRRAAAAKRIITSGPQSIATVSAGSNAARSISRVTTPTGPSQPGAGTSTVTCAPQPSSSSVYSSSAGPRAP